MRLKFTLSAFNAFPNILAWCLAWPASHSCALAGISAPSRLIILNEDSEMLEDPPSFRSFVRKLPRVHGLLASAFPNTECYLASVSGLGIARRWKLNLYWFLSSFPLLCSCGDLENTMDRCSRLSVVPPVKGPLTWVKSSGRELYKGSLRKAHEFRGDTQISIAGCRLCSSLKLSNMETKGISSQLQWDAQHSRNAEPVSACWESLGVINRTSASPSLLFPRSLVFYQQHVVRVLMFSWYSLSSFAHCWRLKHLKL